MEKIRKKAPSFPVGKLVVKVVGARPRNITTCTEGRRKSYWQFTGGEGDR